MTSRIRAINALRPKIELGTTVQYKELVEHISGRTGLNSSEIIHVLTELQDAVIFFGRSGRGVKIPGLGTYLPNVQLDGGLDIEHRLDRELKESLNGGGRFTGNIRNRRNIGKSPDQLVALWNDSHPDELVDSP